MAFSGYSLRVRNIFPSDSKVLIIATFTLLMMSCRDSSYDCGTRFSRRSLSYLNTRGMMSRIVGWICGMLMWMLMLMLMLMKEGVLRSSG